MDFKNRTFSSVMVKGFEKGIIDKDRSQSYLYDPGDYKIYITVQYAESHIIPKIY